MTQLAPLTRKKLFVALGVVVLILPTIAAQPSFAQGASAPSTTRSSYFVRDKTADGLAFVSGGVSIDDRLTMHAERKKYSLWVATVAKPSGAYLADARLKVVEAKGKHTVIDRTLEGPWYMIALPPGRYEVHTTFRADGSSVDQHLSEAVNVTSGTVRQVVFRFDSKAEVSPDMSSPFGGNPFGAPAASK